MNETKTSSKKRVWSWIRDIGIAVIIFSAITVWTTRNMLDTDGSVQVSQANIVSLEGGLQELLSATKPNLIYFFAPWCQICDLSIQNLNYLDNEKVNVVAIALDYQTREEVEQFIVRNTLENDILLGTNELKQAFNVQGYPSYYLIDEEYTVVGKSFGYSTALGLKLRETFGFL
ncbi:MAG: TlpA disulfide reductase family protein [Pseudomonadota bacterium]